MDTPRRSRHGLPLLIFALLLVLVGVPGAVRLAIHREAADLLPAGEVTWAEEPSAERLARDARRGNGAVRAEQFYFLLPDRFANGDRSNDDGDPTASVDDRSRTGLDPTDKGFYHGGDIQGVIDRLDYIQGLGTTAIWLAPTFKNRPVQRYGNDVSAGYHGYWITDFTRVDPHFGSTADLKRLVTMAHRRGIKIYLDVITNHTADVITYPGGASSYVAKADRPYVDAWGRAFDDRNYADGSRGGTFPAVNAGSFPYRPMFASPADATAKTPSWLNDPTMYHNRGNSTFAGENSEYGDFYGLDDLWTERPDVVQGMIKIYGDWIASTGVDGFRIDTTKHVNLDFWPQFSRGIGQRAAAAGKRDFFMFGEAFSADPEVTSSYVRQGELPATLDFGFQAAATGYVTGGSARKLAELYAADDLYTARDTGANRLTTFLGNHDIGRIGSFVAAASPAAGRATAAEAIALRRDALAHELMFLARGQPVVYAGDEQGFTGAGGDRDARQDMFASKTPDYLDDNLLGTDRTHATDSYDRAHPLYRTIAELSALRRAHPALANGIQVTRSAADGPGVFTFSRIDPTQRVEYLVAVNNAATEQRVTVDTATDSATFDQVYPAHSTRSGEASAGPGAPAGVSADGDGRVDVTVPARSAVVYRAGEPLPVPRSTPGITISNPADGAGVATRAEVITRVTGGDPTATVSLAAKVGDGPWRLVGTAVRGERVSGDQASGEPVRGGSAEAGTRYRIFHDLAGGAGTALPAAGTKIEYKAVVRDSQGRTASAETTASVATPVLASSRRWAVVHYQRADGDYTGWKLHAKGDIDPAWQRPWPGGQPFVGQDEYGRFAWVKLKPGARTVEFSVVDAAGEKDADVDRALDPRKTGEVWLRSGDKAVYPSEAAATGRVTVHYTRPDRSYDGWGLHLWGEGLAAGVPTSWTSPRRPDGVDDYGPYWHVPLADAGKVVNAVVHRGDEKDPVADLTIDPAVQGQAWISTRNAIAHRSRAAAEGVAVLHYRRSDGDYAGWGPHVWDGAAQPTEWSAQRRPDRMDSYGAVFRIPLAPAATGLSYLMHRGEDRDLPTDQRLDLVRAGNEVWLQSGVPGYLLPGPMRASARDTDLAKARAHWIDRNTIAWRIAGPTDGKRYDLVWSADGTLAVADGELTGATGSVSLTARPNGLTEQQRERFPHLWQYAAFGVHQTDPAAIKTILRGQVVVTERDHEGGLLGATAVQLPGVLDDAYGAAASVALGPTFSEGNPTLAVWAPTATEVSLELFDVAGAAPGSLPSQRVPSQRVPSQRVPSQGVPSQRVPSQRVPAQPGVPRMVAMHRDDQTGVWRVTGQRDWTGRFYRYRVTAWQPAVTKMVTASVTDPYSVALAADSTHSVIADLADPALAPADWTTLRKPPAVSSSGAHIQELSVRDFSIADESVPVVERGTFAAFARPDSAGMRQLTGLAQAGVTHLHLLPAFDFATIPERRANQATPACDLASFPSDSEKQQTCVAEIADSDGYNWGYDPLHYTVPEGGYATDPQGTARTREFRAMVAALNRAGLRVVMDVVYNHTAATGTDPKSVLDQIVPGYYHRLLDDGSVADSTCCANTAPEHAMMGKLVVDSVVTWAKQYRVDGFRFDLMGHHPKANIMAVRAALDRLTPASDGVDGRSVLLYGEGWDFGEVGNNARFVQATQRNMAGTGVGTFNDRLRDAVRGGGPFDSSPRHQGFASGLFTDPNGDPANGSSAEQRAGLLRQHDLIKVGLTGNLADYRFVASSGATVTGAQVDYNGSPAGYTAAPGESVSYVDAHDNEILYDALAYKLPVGTSALDRARMQVLALSTVVFGQGTGFVTAGSERLRSKSLDRNSYNSGDWFNQIRWDCAAGNGFGIGLPPAADNRDKWPYARPLLADPNLVPSCAAINLADQRYRELLRIRASSPLFGLETAKQVQRQVSFPLSGRDETPGVLTMRLGAGAGSLTVVFNATTGTATQTLPELRGTGTAPHPILRTSVDPVLRTASFEASTGTFTVPARSVAVFVQG